MTLSASRCEPPYYSYRSFMQQRYGTVLHRIPLDLGFSCPHRNEQRQGGCTFCPENGARAVQTLAADTVQQQVTAAIRFARDRYKARTFQLYFQAYTASFDPAHQRQYAALLNQFPFEALSFGLRPDCIEEPALGYLTSVRDTVDTWVELGVQTVHDATLKRINRGHDWAASETAIRQLADAGIQVMVHVILGLPGETPDQFVATAQTLSGLPISAIKIHNLHVIANTALATEYAHSPFPVFDEYQYAEHLMTFIRHLRPDIPIVRMSTDTPGKTLIAPQWHMAKNDFIDHVTNQMIYREMRQGDGQEPSPALDPAFAPLGTQDGSVTFWNPVFKEHFHSRSGARLEAVEKYVQPARIGTGCARRVLDICFGLGYNTLATLNTALETGTTVRVTALEMDKRVVRAAARYLAAQPDDRFDWPKLLQTLVDTDAVSVKGCGVQMLWGDSRHTITRVTPGYDVVYLDAFSTNRNSELWTLDFFEQIRAVLQPGGVLITYSASLPVRSGLRQAGFFVGETPPVGRARGGTLASMDASRITRPLPECDTLLMSTTRGLPFRDPFHVWTNKAILRHREERVKQAANHRPTEESQSV